MGCAHFDFHQPVGVREYAGGCRGPQLKLYLGFAAAVTTQEKERSRFSTLTLIARFQLNLNQPQLARLRPRPTLTEARRIVPKRYRSEKRGPQALKDRTW
jgi:hypothetical protein